MSMSHLCPFRPPGRLPVDSAHTHQQLPVFSAWGCSLASGALLGPFTEQTRVLVNPCLQERPPMRETNQQIRSPACFPQWNNSEVLFYSFSTSPSHSEPPLPSVVIHSSTHSSLAFLVSSSHFPTPLLCFLESLPNELFALPNPCVRVCFWGSRTKASTKPSAWCPERDPSAVPRRAPYQNHTTQKLFEWLFSQFSQQKCIISTSLDACKRQ